MGPSLVDSDHCWVLPVPCRCLARHGGRHRFWCGRPRHRMCDRSGSIRCRRSEDTNEMSRTRIGWHCSALPVALLPSNVIRVLREMRATPAGSAVHCWRRKNAACWQVTRIAHLHALDTVCRAPRDPSVRLPTPMSRSVSLVRGWCRALQLCSVSKAILGAEASSDGACPGHKPLWFGSLRLPACCNSPLRAGIQGGWDGRPCGPRAAAATAATAAAASSGAAAQR
jgi:hypothetical protein